jgi:hypothetical protein
LLDVVRSAVSETAGYELVTVNPVARVALAGPVCCDVIHLLAELIESVTLQTRPPARVAIGAEETDAEVLIRITGDIPAPTGSELAKLNEFLLRPEQVSLPGSRYRRHHLAGRLAQRHNIRIVVRAGDSGHSNVAVAIPSRLLVDDIDTTETVPLPILPSNGQECRPVTSKDDAA